MFFKLKVIIECLQLIVWSQPNSKCLPQLIDLSKQKWLWVVFLLAVPFSWVPQRDILLQLTLSSFQLLHPHVFCLSWQPRSDIKLKFDVVVSESNLQHTRTLYLCEALLPRDKTKSSLSLLIVNSVCRKRQWALTQILWTKVRCNKVWSGCFFILAENIWLRWKPFFFYSILTILLYFPGDIWSCFT